MRPVNKRTIITSKATGRRYYLIRSSNRAAGRRYYVCSRPDCEARVTREADLFCRTHSHRKSSENENITDISTKSDYIDENSLNNSSEMVDEETPIMDQQNTKLDSDDDNQQNEIENNDSTTTDYLDDISSNGNTSLPLTSRQKAKTNRQLHVDESTGTRSFVDSSGRRRYLCMISSCTNMIRAQADIFCRTHTNNDVDINKTKKTRENHNKRYSAPPLSNQTKNRFRSPSSTTNTTSSTIIETKTENGTNGNHSEEYESPEKTPERSGTNRSFRDASGRLRFLCSNPSCTTRVVRQSDTFCKKHQLEDQAKSFENNVQSMITTTTIKHYTEEKSTVEKMDVNHNTTDTLSEQISSETSTKKRKYGTQTSISKSINLSSIPADKIVLSTTTLLDNQWTAILTVLRQFSQVQLSTNLNVNNSTTHLLVDDSENYLHCTITKKIVQAAVRRHVFIISSRWINECIRLNEFIDEHPYEIISDSHTTLRLSIQNFQTNNKYLFNNSSLKYTYGFAIECHQCQGSINRNELIELIELAGAKLYDNDSTIDMLIVLCDTNDKNLDNIKEKYIETNISNIKYVTSDFLLKSIVKFEIQDIDKYSL